MKFDINEFYNKSTERARKLANELGVEFKEVDANKIQEETLERIRLMEEYEANKEKYDKLVEQALTVCKPDEILDFIKQNTKPK